MSNPPTPVQVEHDRIRYLEYVQQRSDGILTDNVSLCTANERLRAACVWLTAALAIALASGTVGWVIAIRSFR
jgi:hypothetical protein